MLHCMQLKVQPNLAQSCLDSVCVQCLLRHSLQIRMDPIFCYCSLYTKLVCYSAIQPTRMQVPKYIVVSNAGTSSAASDSSISMIVALNCM